MARAGSSNRKKSVADNAGSGGKKKLIDETMKRVIQVVEPEQENGDTEYKRQVHEANASRLRSLQTQMSYRLDQGGGRCHYRIGVEDNGCHSLLSLQDVLQSICVLKCIARSLNAVVETQTLVQNEVVWNGSRPIGVKDADDADVLNGGNRQPVRSVQHFTEHDLECNTAVDDDRIQEEGMNFTRAELTLHRIETHLLDPSPMSLADIAKANNTAVSPLTSKAEKYKAKMAAKKQSEEEEEEKKETETQQQQQQQQPTTSPTTGEKKAPPKQQQQENRIEETLSSRNIRVAVVGNVDAGKSTLIGTLTTSSLDDGRGKSRTAIMKHRHEIQSGRTSTATTHLMGFKSTGHPVTGRDQVFRTSKRKTQDEIARESYRIITLMDLAGHEKYLKTTIHGVSSGFSDYALILVNSRHPPTHMTQHHLNLCCSFAIPVIVIFTKIDGCPEHAFKTCKQEVIKMLRSPEVGKKPFAVRNETDITTVMDKMQALAPMIETSCVSGEGIDLLQKMLFSLPKRRRHENKVNRKFEFLVEDIFNNVPGVGSVVSGFVNAGELTVGPNCHVHVGPTDDGSFIKTVAKSAHIARINTTHITSGQSACLAFSLNKELRKKLRRGMVVLKDDHPTSTRQFDAEICVLKGEGTTIRRSYQAYVHILNVRQSAFARDIQIVHHSHHTAGLPPRSHGVDDDDNDNDDEDDEQVWKHGGGRGSSSKSGIVLRPGSRAKVRFEFAKRPEYIRPGMRMLFRDGRVRGVGIITAIPVLEAQS